MYRDLLLVAGGALIGLGITLLVWQLHDVRRRLRDLETKSAEPCKHQLKHIVRADVGEAFLFDFVDLREDLKIAQRKLEHFTRRAAHVAAGGSPDDPPTQWKE